MRVEDGSPAGLKIIEYEFFEDNRGWFVETFNSDEFEAHRLPTVWLQDSWSYSRQSGTIRGLHYQADPVAQGKLIRVPKGRVLDIAVDIRTGSPSFSEYFSIELHPQIAIYLPRGFAHGFCTLEEDSEVSYKMTSPFSPSHSRSILWNDPEIGIEWPIHHEKAIVSDRDRRSPMLKDASDLF